MSQIPFSGLLAMVNTPSSDGRVLLLSQGAAPAMRKIVPIVPWGGGPLAGAIGYIGREGDQLRVRGWVEDRPNTRHVKDGAHLSFSVTAADKVASPDGGLLVFIDWVITSGCLFPPGSDTALWGAHIKADE